MVHGHPTMNGVSVSGEVLPGLLRPRLRLHGRTEMHQQLSAFVTFGVQTSEVGLALETPLDYLDDMRRKVGNIAQGLMLYLAIFTVVAAQKVCVINPAATLAGDSGHMNGTYSDCHMTILHYPNHVCQALYWLLIAYIVDTTWLRNARVTLG